VKNHLPRAFISSTRHRIFLYIYIPDFKTPERKSLVALEPLKKSSALHNKSQKHQTTFCSIRDQQSHRKPITKSKHLTNLTNKQAWAYPKCYAHHNRTSSHVAAQHLGWMMKDKKVANTIRCNWGRQFTHKATTSALNPCYAGSVHTWASGTSHTSITF